MSQCARLYNRLCLYNEAIPMLKAVIKMEKEESDTVNLIYDLQLLGDTYMRMDSLDLAEKAFGEAIVYGKDQPDYHLAKSQMYLAYIYCEQGKTDLALRLINGVPDRVKPLVRDTALSYASIIYYNAGMMDSAYRCAKEIVADGDEISKLSGYQIMLSPIMMRELPEDSLREHIWKYRKLIERRLDLNQNQLAVNQENFYNYTLHIKEKEAAEKSNSFLKNIIVLSLLALAILSFILLCLRIRNRNNLIALHEALDLINRLHMRDSDLNKMSIDSEVGIRERMKAELISLCDEKGNDIVTPQAITRSEAYQKLFELLVSDKVVPIGSGDKIWSDIEKAVLESSPNFRSNLNLLAKGKLSIDEYHTAILIKCGFKPAQMARLFGRSAGAISTRRKSISLKLIDVAEDPKLIVMLIRLL